jgi:hypothetical protein
MRVAGGQLYAGESSVLELADKPLPCLPGLPIGHLKSQDLPLAVLAYANGQHGGRSSHTAF